MLCFKDSALMSFNKVTTFQSVSFPRSRWRFAGLSGGSNAPDLPAPELDSCKPALAGGGDALQSRRCPGAAGSGLSLCHSGHPPSQHRPREGAGNATSVPETSLGVSAAGTRSFMALSRARRQRGAQGCTPG